jgi:hypothetical protein
MTYDTVNGITTVRWTNQAVGGEFFFTVTVDAFMEDEARTYINEAVMVTAIDQLEMPTNKTYHYAEWHVQLTDVTVSKSVTGDFSNMTREFAFTIIFKDSDGITPLPEGTRFSYIGNIIDDSGATAPQDGILILDRNGSAEFTLGHGQVIVIQDVSIGNYMQIIEEPGEIYAARFTDSENSGVIVERNYTDLLAITENRIFSFTNERNYIPPTGIALGGNEGIILLVGLIALPVLGMFALDIAVRRRVYQ